MKEVNKNYCERNNKKNKKEEVQRKLIKIISKTKTQISVSGSRKKNEKSNDKKQIIRKVKAINNKPHVQSVFAIACLEPYVLPDTITPQPEI